MTFEKTWKGASNSRYIFQTYLHNSNWPYWGGIYMYCRRLQAGWEVHYIGETDNFAETIKSNHHAWLFAHARGATHVHILLNSDSQNRKKVEFDLISALNPIRNQQLRTDYQQAQGWL